MNSSLSFSAISTWKKAYKTRSNNIKISSNIERKKQFIIRSTETRKSLKNNNYTIECFLMKNKLNGHCRCFSNVCEKKRSFILHSLSSTKNKKFE